MGVEAKKSSLSKTFAFARSVVSLVLELTGNEASMHNKNTINLVLFHLNENCELNLTWISVCLASPSLLLSLLGVHTIGSPVTHSTDKNRCDCFLHIFFCHSEKQIDMFIATIRNPFGSSLFQVKHEK